MCFGLDRLKMDKTPKKGSERSSDPKITPLSPTGFYGTSTSSQSPRLTQNSSSSTPSRQRSSTTPVHASDRDRSDRNRFMSPGAKKGYKKNRATPKATPFKK